MKCLKRNVFRSLQSAHFNTDLVSGSALIPTIRNPSDIRVIIVGAGLAGLSAAKHLIKNGFTNTVVLEATERLGGRIRSKQFGDAFCELGAKWVPMDSSKNSVYELARQATGLQKNLETTFKKDIAYMNTNGERIDNSIPQAANALFRKVCMGIALDEKYKSGCLHDLNSVKTYFEAETKNLLESFKPKDRPVAADIFNTLAKDYSALMGSCLEYVNIEHITKLSRFHNVGPIYMPTGMDNVLHQITRDVKGECLRTGKPVGEINWLGGPSDYTKTVRCMDGQTFAADHIICTLPLGVLKNFMGFMFKPMLPKEKQFAILNLGFGTPVKVYFEYNRNIQHWFQHTIRPVWTEEKRDLNAPNWIRQVYEITDLPSSMRVLEVRVGGSYYEDFEKLPDESLVEEVTKLLRKCLKNNKVPYPKQVLRSNWSLNSCYMGGRPFFSTQSSLHDVITLGAPLGDAHNLLFAGDATTVKGFGTVDGARLSGIREAERIIDFHYKRSMHG